MTTPTDTMSKSDRIRALLKEGRTPKDIAREVGCPTAYVSVVRGRTDPEGRPVRRESDKKHQAERTRRYREDPQFRASVLAYAQARRQRNIEQVRAHNRAYRTRRYREDPEFRERLVAAQRRRREENREHVRARNRDYQRRRRARLKAERAAQNAVQGGDPHVHA